MVEVDSFSPKSEARIRPRARRRPSSSSPGRRHFPRLGRSLALPSGEPERVCPLLGLSFHLR
jgi:hypothetical protein